MSNIENKILEAVEIIVDSAVKSAGFDSTVIATVKECIDIANGKYRCKYQDSMIYAYADNNNYSVGEQVYVLVPNSDLSNSTKKILGLAKEGGTGIAEGSISYSDLVGRIIDTLGTDNYFTGTTSIDLHSGKINEKIFLYPKDTLSDSISIDNQAIKSYLAKSDKLMLSCNFRIDPKLSSDKILKCGKYGVCVRVNYKNLDNNKIVTLEYVINQNYVPGNPYKLNNKTYTEVFFDKPENYEYHSIESVYAYCGDFVDKSEDNPPSDIHMSDITFLGVKIIEGDDIGGYNLVVKSTKNGIFPKDNSLDAVNEKITTRANLFYRQAAVPEGVKVNYYWFRENDGVTSSDLAIYGNIFDTNNAWEKLSLEQSTIDFKREDIYGRYNVFKCVAKISESNGNVIWVSKDFLLYDYNKDLYIIESTRGTEFTDYTLTNLVVKTEKGYLTKEGLANLSFQWKEDNMVFPSITENENKTVSLNNSKERWNKNIKDVLDAYKNLYKSSYTNRNSILQNLIDITLYDATVGNVKQDIVNKKDSSKTEAQSDLDLIAKTYKEEVLSYLIDSIESINTNSLPDEQINKEDINSYYNDFLRVDSNIADVDLTPKQLNVITDKLKSFSNEKWNTIEAFNYDNYKLDIEKPETTSSVTASQSNLNNYLSFLENKTEYERNKNAGTEYKYNSSLNACINYNNIIERNRPADIANCGYYKANSTNDFTVKNEYSYYYVNGTYYYYTGLRFEEKSEKELFTNYGNVLYNVKSSSFYGDKEFSCTVYKGSGKENQGKARIKLTSKLQDNRKYSLKVIGGRAHLYDENGKLYESENTSNSYTLTFKLTDNTGEMPKEITEETIRTSNSYNTSWRVGKNSLITINNSNITSSDESYNKYNGLLSLSYSIDKTYSITESRAANSRIYLDILDQYGNVLVTADSGVSLEKQGNPGTNGTGFVCSIEVNSEGLGYRALKENEYPTLEYVYEDTDSNARYISYPKFNFDVFDYSGDGQIQYGYGSEYKETNLREFPFKAKLSYDGREIQLDDNYVVTWDVVKHNYGNHLEDVSSFSIVDNVLICDPLIKRSSAFENGMLDYLSTIAIRNIISGDSLERQQILSQLSNIDRRISIFNDIYGNQDNVIKQVGIGANIVTEYVNAVTDEYNMTSYNNAFRNFWKDSQIDVNKLFNNILDKYLGKITPGNRGCLHDILNRRRNGINIITKINELIDSVKNSSIDFYQAWQIYKNSSIYTDVLNGQSEKHFKISVFCLYELFCNALYNFLRDINKSTLLDKNNTYLDSSFSSFTNNLSFSDPMPSDKQQIITNYIHTQSLYDSMDAITQKRAELGTDGRILSAILRAQETLKGVSSYNELVLSNYINLDFCFSPDKIVNNIGRSEGAAPADIIKCTIMEKGTSNTYTAVLPIAVAAINNSTSQDIYKIGFKNNSGFKYVKYDADGANPQYDSSNYFEMELYKKVGNDWINVSQTAQNIYLYTDGDGREYYYDSKQSLETIHGENAPSSVVETNKSGLQNYSFIWGSSGTYYENNKTDNTIPMLQTSQDLIVLDSENTSYRTMYKAIDNYSGRCITNAVECSVYLGKDSSSSTYRLLSKIRIPIYFYLNLYGQKVLNEWDGTSVTINQEGGYILAPQIGAGKKESDNSFTGMVMGTTVTDGGTEKVGLLGYSSGVQSIFMNAKDGSVVLGKNTAGSGQIIMDPTQDKALIYSRDYFKEYNKYGLPKSYDVSNLTITDLSNQEEEYKELLKDSKEIYEFTSELNATVGKIDENNPSYYKNIPLPKGTENLSAFQLSMSNFDSGLPIGGDTIDSIKLAKSNVIRPDDTGEDVKKILEMLKCHFGEKDYYYFFPGRDIACHESALESTNLYKLDNRALIKSYDQLYADIFEELKEDYSDKIIDYEWSNNIGDLGEDTLPDGGGQGGYYPDDPDSTYEPPSKPPSNPNPDNGKFVYAIKEETIYKLQYLYEEKFPLYYMNGTKTELFDFFSPTSEIENNPLKGVDAKDLLELKKAFYSALFAEEIGLKQTSFKTTDLEDELDDIYVASCFYFGDTNKPYYSTAKFEKLLEKEFQFYCGRTELNPKDTAETVGIPLIPQTASTSLVMQTYTMVKHKWEAVLAHCLLKLVGKPVYKKNSDDTGSLIISTIWKAKWDSKDSTKIVQEPDLKDTIINGVKKDVFSTPGSALTAWQQDFYKNYSVQIYPRKGGDLAGCTLDHLSKCANLIYWRNVKNVNAPTYKYYPQMFVYPSKLINSSGNGYNNYFSVGLKENDDQVTKKIHGWDIYNLQCILADMDELWYKPNGSEEKITSYSPHDYVVGEKKNGVYPYLNVLRGAIYRLNKRFLNNDDLDTGDPPPARRVTISGTLKQDLMQNILLYHRMYKVDKNDFNKMGLAVFDDGVWAFEGATSLKSGASGLPVRRLHFMLAKAGYGKCAGKLLLNTFNAKNFTYRSSSSKAYVTDANDYYGNATVKAVKDFQSKHNLAVDGIYGEKTHTKLFEYLRDTKKLERGTLNRPDKMMTYKPPKGSVKLFSVGNNSTPVKAKAMSAAGLLKATDTAKLDNDFSKESVKANGIDVSYWQSDTHGKSLINWNTAKKTDGINFAMVRAGIRYANSRELEQDSSFDDHVCKAVAAGIEVGAYFYTSAFSVAEAQQEADFVIKILEKYKKKGIYFKYPIAIDVESDTQISKLQLNGSDNKKTVLTNIVNAFCKRINEAGYYPIIYTNPNWLTNNLNKKDIKYDLWLAHWTSNGKESPYRTQNKRVGLWQYSNNGKYKCYSKGLDCNNAYADYPSLIEDKGLNGLSSSNNKGMAEDVLQSVTSTKKTSSGISSTITEVKPGMIDLSYDLTASFDSIAVKNPLKNTIVRQGNETMICCCFNNSVYSYQQNGKLLATKTVLESKRWKKDASSNVYFMGAGGLIYIYQYEKGLPITGIIDQETLKYLQADYAVEKYLSKINLSNLLGPTISFEHGTLDSACRPSGSSDIYWLKKIINKFKPFPKERENRVESEYSNYSNLEEFSLLERCFDADVEKVTHYNRYMHTDSKTGEIDTTKYVGLITEALMSTYEGHAKVTTFKDVVKKNPSVSAVASKPSTTVYPTNEEEYWLL